MKSFSNKHESLDTELNIVPIIDCFVMLICFLLFTAAFTQLVYMEAKIAASTRAAADKSRSEMDQYRLVVTLGLASVSLKTTGSAVRKNVQLEIPNVAGAYDLKTLHQKIVELKIDNPDRFSADIEVPAKQSASIQFEQLMLVMDAIRHLDDEEFAQMGVTKKKLQQIELTETEATKQIRPEIAALAQSVLGNSVAANTDNKLLFPDIAVLDL